MTIQGSIFYKLLRTNAQGVIGHVNFISVTSKEGSPVGTPLIMLQDNHFSNSTLLNTQGYTNSIYQSSLIYIVALKAQALFNNNSFNLITVMSKGDIMTLSIPTIKFSTCEFYNISSGSEDGAINLVFETLSVVRCLFSGSKSLDSDGSAYSSSRILRLKL